MFLHTHKLSSNTEKKSESSQDTPENTRYKEKYLGFIQIAIFIPFNYQKIICPVVKIGNISKTDFECMLSSLF